MTCAFGAAAVLLAGAVVAPGAAFAAPTQDVPPAQTAPHKEDDRPDTLAAKQREAKMQAAEMVATGKAEVQTKGTGKNASKVVEIAPDKFVEYGVQETAQLFSILVEFGDENASPYFPDAPVGPLHNEIPEPSAEDNSTYWEEDFSREHYMEMFFTGLEDQGGESFKGVYKEMSSGRFDLQGDVSDWVQVPYNQATYGGASAAGDETQASMTAFIQDTANAWYEQQLAQGKTKDEIVAYLQSFDVWDRYDLDGDGIINEPDGYIDHFQAIHAGEGEEAGAPPWAIWSHRWAVNQGGLGVDGPSGYEKLGGVQIGDTDIWIRDYTTEPENGGLGVFAHEFGHDLGLPDYYDTRGGENGTAYWTLMSSGSWLGHGEGTIGTTPNHMGAHEKLYLGWLDYETVDAGESATVDLGPAFHASTLGAQAAVVNLPPGVQSIEVAAPHDGKYVYSGTANNLDSTIASPAFVVPDAATLTAKANYAIEVGYDYAYVEVSTDGGETWTAVETNRSGPATPGSGNTGYGIDGTTDGQWVDLTADLSAYAGATAQLRFRYVSDGGVNELGFLVDDVAVGEALVEDFEQGTGDWASNGFVLVTDGAYDQEYEHYYLVENRVYGGYDSTLATGPYNFGWPLSKPDTVEHFPYQDGLLIWYVNSLYGDNNVSQHPGAGQALPVDARPGALRWSDGTVARNRIQSFDATFGLKKADKLNLHRETAAGMTTLKVGKQDPVSVFDDTDPYAYYDTANPQNSVIVAGTGTRVEVVKQNVNKGTMTIKVNGGSAPEPPAAAAWDASKVYTNGDTVTHAGATWLASWWTQGQTPGDPYGPWQELKPADAEGVSEWAPSRIYTGGETVKHAGTKYVAQWWTRNQAPGDAYGPWRVVG
ncbi:peptidase M6 [Xylanimonas oleitrophica]|uniref:Peptidase M6 n=1 Tax=Xylanimonas oleitrophica TaxID=2607479 RepID=A0A2W5WMD3_9MICO|nr:immune inhibitor A domain-containing protein [Xylanimonas oleitrophica]PZR52360.1 peptidase M6 [Xylanimonas oleitrophica]